MEIKTLSATDVRHVFHLQIKYEQVYPGAAVLPGEFYLSPAFHGGQDVYCAYENDRLVAYAPVYVQIVEGPGALPHIAWCEIKADPEIVEIIPIKDALLDCVVKRARQLTASTPDRPVQMIFQYMANETPSVAYVQSRGFAYTESVYSMCRDLYQLIPTAPALDGVDLRRWKMATLEEQRAYVAARNECFPEAPITLEAWQYLLGSPGWAEASTIAAFDGETLAGCLTAYWDDNENGQSGVQAGHTEYIFVRPAWRGRGIAGALICEGMRYLKEHGKQQARLEVRAMNENALGLYQRLGYQVVGESQFYAKQINECQTSSQRVFQ